MAKDKDLSHLIAVPVGDSKPPPAPEPEPEPEPAPEARDEPEPQPEASRVVDAPPANDSKRLAGLVALPEIEPDATSAPPPPSGEPAAPEALDPVASPAESPHGATTTPRPAGPVDPDDLLTRLGEAPVRPVVVAERRSLPLAGVPIIDVWSIEPPRSPADGVRILAPAGRQVHAVESGVVVDRTATGDVGSEHLVIRTRDGDLHHYHELEPGSVVAERGATVRGGAPVGRVAAAAREGWTGIRLASQRPDGDWRNPYEELVGLPDPAELYADPDHLDAEVVAELEGRATERTIPDADLLAPEPEGTPAPALADPLAPSDPMQARPVPSDGETDRVSRLVAGLGPEIDRRKR